MISAVTPRPAPHNTARDPVRQEEQHRVHERRLAEQQTLVLYARAHERQHPYSVGSYGLVDLYA